EGLSHRWIHCEPLMQARPAHHNGAPDSVVTEQLFIVTVQIGSAAAAKQTERVCLHSTVYEHTPARKRPHQIPAVLEMVECRFGARLHGTNHRFGDGTPFRG